MSRYLVVDGMMSGSGIRDEYSGEYLNPRTLGLSNTLTSAIAEWLERYRELHFDGYADSRLISELDEKGRVIAAKVAEELPEAKVSYYSDATTTKIQVVPS